MTEDNELLRQYYEERSDRAFAQLVQRRVGLVYSVALRQMQGDAHRAHDVTQTVFTDLARKAGVLCRRPVVIGWLYRSAQFAARQAMRTEQRRVLREQEAFRMNEALPNDESAWEKIRPVLDDALSELDERDRDAISLRFFEERPFAEVGAKLQLSENAARMRVERALDKLHGLLARRGITSTTAALGLVLTTQVSAVAPASMAAAVSALALAGAATATASTAAGSLMTLMGSVKLQVGVTAALAIAGVTSMVIQSTANGAAREEIARLQEEERAFRQVKDENRKLADEAARWSQSKVDDTALARLDEAIASAKLQLANAARAGVLTRSTAAAGGMTTPSPSQSVYSFKDVDKQPTSRFQAKPVYPFELARNGVTGNVLVAMVVDASGNVTQARVVKSTHPGFEEAAIKAVEKWKFQPGQKAGLPVNVEMQVPIVFSIDKNARPGLGNWF